jgi:hypothetical protein
MTSFGQLWPHSGRGTILGGLPGDVRGIRRRCRVKRTNKDSTDSTALPVCAMSAHRIGHGTNHTRVPFLARALEEEDREEELVFLWIVESQELIVAL